jgi:N-acetyl-alpha-D-glucosaminyl L-malate synthase BshA
VSRWLKDETIRIFNPKRNIRVIPNFVDIKAFRPRDLSDRRSQFAAPGEKILLHISNFRPVKNLPALVEVFDRVRGEHPARLLLVGDGPERGPVETLVHERGLGEAVTFLGNQEYVEDLLPHADVFLLPSLHESFGLVALEAMAVGVPVVATNVGGPNEVVVDGECGFLRGPRDVPGMVEAVLRILTDPGLASAMGEAGVRRVRESFTLDTIVPQYLDAYVSACG